MERFSSPEQPERLRPNDAQESKLRALCEAYAVDYDETHYFVYPPESTMMAGWCEGNIGGPDYNGRTLYVGVSPEGQAHS